MDALVTEGGGFMIARLISYLRDFALALGTGTLVTGAGTSRMIWPDFNRLQLISSE